MKKNKQKAISLSTFGLTAALTTGILFSQAITLNDATVNYQIETVADRSDFVSQQLKNNEIENLGGPNHQYQSLVDSIDINNPELYNGQNVLSNHSIQTVRSENFFFNFIKSPIDESSPDPVLELQTYHIMVTPVDPYSRITPLKVDTDYIHMNGSALWIKDRLILTGTNTAGNLLFSAYEQNDETGQLTLTDTLEATDEASYSQLHNLQSIETKTIDYWIKQETYNVPYTTFSKPIYLSPVTNLQNPQATSFSLVAWSGNTYGQIFNQAANLVPVKIDYSPESGFSKNLQALSVNVALPTELPTNVLVTTEKLSEQFILNSEVVAISPLIDESGNFRIYTHSINGFQGTTTNENGNIVNVRGSIAIVSEVELNNLEWKINSFSNETFLIADGFNANDLVVTRDPMNWLPYGLFARGDENGFNEENTLNLFLLFTQDMEQKSFGLASNVTISSVNGQNVLNAPAQMQIKLYFANGAIFTNFLFTDQLYYPNVADIENGTEIAIRYHGVGQNYNVARVGTLSWKTPWDVSTWSNEATWFGSSVVEGYNATHENAGNNAGYFFEDVMPTVWNNTYIAPGIYQEKSNTNGERVGVKIVARDLSLGFNEYNTAIPKNIVVQDDVELDPSKIGNQGIIELITPYSKDFPLTASELLLKNISFENNILSISGDLANPYVNGLQVPSNPVLPFDTRITFAPTNQEVIAPISINPNEITKGYASIVEVPVSEALEEPGKLIANENIIGTQSTHLIQVSELMFPFLTNINATADDFLGKLVVEYTITPESIAPYTVKVEIGGFWGNVYIIPIVLGSVLFIGLVIGLTFFLVKRNHKENLKTSLQDGFQLQRKRSSKLKIEKKIKANKNKKPVMNHQVKSNTVKQFQPNSNPTNNIQKPTQNLSSPISKPSKGPTIRIDGNN